MINEKESNINVIKYTIDKFETVDDFTLQMLKTNPIPGIIPIGRRDNDFLIPISNLKKLDDYLKEDIVTVDEVLNILKQYDELLALLDNYMIPSEELILDYDYTFMDGDVLTFILIPTNYSHLHSHTKYEFTLSALLAPNYRTTEDRLKVFEVLHPCLPPLREVSRSDGGRCKKNSKEEKKLKKRNKQQPQNKLELQNSTSTQQLQNSTNTQQLQNNTNTQQLQNNTNTQQEPGNYKKPKKQSRLSILKEKIFSGGEDDVFDFPSEEILPQGIHVIIVRSTKAEYPLLFGPDYIGTDPTACSICFAGNATMSAEHCVITLARGHYFIADLNSKSGTLLNGQPLEPGKTYELRSADLITVAGEELVFSKRG